MRYPKTPETGLPKSRDNCAGAKEGCYPCAAPDPRTVDPNGFNSKRDPQMPTIRLTQNAVDRLKPPADGRVSIGILICPGLGCASPHRGRSTKGRKTWQCLYRVNSKLVRETLGTLELIPKVDEGRRAPSGQHVKGEVGRTRLRGAAV